MTPKVTRMVMRFGCQQRKQPREGDTKVVKGVKYVRQQVREARTGAGYVQNGRPVFEWVASS